MERTILLRAGLLFNALFSSLCATWLLIDPHRFTASLALPPSVLRGLGVSLALFVVSLVFLATRRRARLLESLLTTIADGGWVVGSVAFLMLWTGTTPEGTWLVIDVALAVGFAAVLQFIGLMRAVSEPRSDLPTTHRIEVVGDVEVSRSQFWRHLSDLESIRHHSAGLAESFLRTPDHAGVGTQRECASTDGSRWAEQVTSWRPEEGFDVTFLADEDGFPFPARQMVGGWRLEALDETHTRVTVWWSLLPKGLPGILLVPLMSARLQRDFPSVFRSISQGIPTR